MFNFFSIIKPILFTLEPEYAHKIAIFALKRNLIKNNKLSNKKLKQNIFGLNFINPIGLAAGFDKNGQIINEILKIGFSFTEIGSITPKAQIGNPKPRIFRIKEHVGIINRMGFNNDGHNIILTRLYKQYLIKKKGQLGVNIAANKNSIDFILDYEIGIKKFYNVTDYFTANISSPNTPGIRSLQFKDNLEKLINRICKKRIYMQKITNKYVPILIKISPDLTNDDIDDIANIILSSKIDGIIISNTTIKRHFIKGHIYEKEIGGLSGKPLFNLSTYVLARFYQSTKGKIPLIGVGGISNGNDAYEKICAGASLIQLYSCIIYNGINVINNINQDILKKLKYYKYNNIHQAIGSKSKFWSNKY